MKIEYLWMSLAQRRRLRRVSLCLFKLQATLTRMNRKNDLKVKMTKLALLFIKIDRIPQL